MFGIVRLFSEQVRETEKEAETCLRRVLTRPAHMSNSNTAIINNMVTAEVESRDLLDLWKKSSHILDMIDCAAGAAPTLATRKNAMFPGAQAPSSVWRDEEDQNNATIDFIDQQYGDGNEYISLPRAAPSVVWPASSTTFTLDDIDPVRGIDVTAQPAIVFPSAQDSDFAEVSAMGGGSTHFLDRLLEKHDETGEMFDFTHDGTEESMRAALETSTEQLRARLEDLLLPPPADANLGDDNAFMQSLYESHTYLDGADPGQDTFMDAGAMENFEPEMPAAAIDESDPSATDMQLLLSTTLTETNNSYNKKKRARTYPYDENPTFTHEESRLAIENLPKTPRRKDYEILSDPKLVSKRLRDQELENSAFSDVSKVMGLPEGKSTRIGGTLEYIQLLHTATIAAGVQGSLGNASLNELSYMPFADGSNVFGSLLEESMQPSMIFAPIETSLLDRTAEDQGNDYFMPMDEARRANAVSLLENTEQERSGPLVQPTEANIDYNDGNDYFNDLGMENHSLSFDGGDEYGLQFEAAAQNRSLGIDDQETLEFPMRESQEWKSRRSLSQSIGEKDENGGAFRREEARGVTRALLGYLSAKATAMTSRQREKSITSANDQSESRERTFEEFSTITVSKLLDGCRRRTAARTFLHLLELTSGMHIQLTQDDFYGEIVIHVQNIT